MLHHIKQGGETAIMIETAFRMCPKTVERSGAIAAVRRAIGLKIVNANIRRQMHVPTRLGHQWRHMARAALCFAAEERAAPRSCRLVKTAGRRRRRCDG